MSNVVTLDPSNAPAVSAAKAEGIFPAPVRREGRVMRLLDLFRARKPAQASASAATSPNDS